MSRRGGGSAPTPLMCAATTGKEKVIQLLTSNIHDGSFLKNCVHWSSLAIAITARQCAFLKMLWSLMGPKAILRNEYGRRPLFHAIVNIRTE